MFRLLTLLLLHFDEVVFEIIEALFLTGSVLILTSFTRLSRLTVFAKFVLLKNLVSRGRSLQRAKVVVLLGVLDCINLVAANERLFLGRGECRLGRFFAFFTRFSWLASLSESS